MHKAFVIVKPDGIRFLRLLEDVIIQKGYLTEAVYFIHDWGLVAKNIYRQDWLKRRSKPAELEAKLWLTRHLFGNNGLVVVITGVNSKKNDKSFIRYGDEVKKSFRKLSCDNINDSVIIAISLDSLKFIQIQEHYIAGKSEFSSPRYKHLNQIVTEPGYWSRCRFTHIHAPDPLIMNVSREWDLLNELGITADENLISTQQWEFMKTYRCPILPLQLNQKKPVLGYPKRSLT